MLDLFVPFTFGLLGGLHCMGMCGPLVIAYSLHLKSMDPSGAAAVSTLAPRMLLSHLLYHSGRVFSYGFLGAAAAGLFQSIEVQSFTAHYRGGFMLFAGFLLIAFGLAFGGVLPIPSLIGRLSGPGKVGRTIARLAGSPSLASKAGMGLAAGFIPCGLTWAMLVNAAGTLDAGRGFLTMVSFGLGTIPVLLMTGFSASLISAKVRMLGEKAAAFMIIVMGATLLVKGGALIFELAGRCH